jgi:hypothetical protein
MKKMLRNSVILAAVTVSIAVGQQGDLFNQAPPEVDKALRERASGFFQDHMDGKFRHADTYVAEDSKDAFFNMEKARYLGFEIIRINYSDNFTKAKVITALKMNLRLRGSEFPATAPLTSNWRLEKGEWCWYRDLEQGKETPFGQLKTEGLSTGEIDPKALFKDPTLITTQIVVDKTEVKLSSFEVSHDKVVVTNNMQGEVSLRFECDPANGFSYSLSKNQLKAGEKATITFDYEPPDASAKPTLSAKIIVDPLNAAYPLRLTFAVPESVQKQLPKQ